MFTCGPAFWQQPGGFSNPSLIFYEAENLSPGEMAVGDPVTEQGVFLARLVGTIEIEDFESYVDGQSLTATNFSKNGITMTCSSKSFSSGAVVATTADLGRFNTTAGGEGFAQTVGASLASPFVLSFDSPIAAFGAYLTDLGDFSGQVSVQMVTGEVGVDEEWPTVVLLINGDTGITDSSSYGRTITVNGNAASSSGAAKFGAGGIAFDGTNDYLSIAFADELNFNGKSFTLEGHAKLDTNTGGRTLVDFRGSGSGGWEIACNAANRTIYVWTGSSTILLSANNSLPAQGNWFHWRVVRSRDTGLTKIYIDDVQVSSTSYNPASTNASGLRIGINNALNNDWHGAMDNIRFSLTDRPSGSASPPTEAFPEEGYPFVDINHSPGATDGALYFWGFVDTTGTTYTKLKFYCNDLPEGDEDFWGFDDMIFCTDSDIIP